MNYHQTARALDRPALPVWIASHAGGLPANADPVRSSEHVAGNLRRNDNGRRDQIHCGRNSGQEVEMKSERLKACLDTIRWGPATLAQSLDVRPRVVEDWLDDRTEVPASVASWLEALCFTHEAAHLLRPAVLDDGVMAGGGAVRRPEHIPVYSYGLLRRLTQGPVLLRTLYGTDEEAAVFFLVSRGLAERIEGDLAVTVQGAELGQILT